MRLGLQLRVVVLVGLTITAAGRGYGGDASLDDLLATLKQVGPRNVGQPAARDTWRKLAGVDAKQLPAVLAGLDDANPLTANWIRSAVDAIVQRAKSLPRPELEQFLFDRAHAPRARRFAYEILLRGDLGLAERAIPRMLDDPSLEFRRDAVARVLAEADRLATAEPLDRAGTIAEYQRAFDAALDLDQVKQAAERLAHFGQIVDVPRHFGFINDWQVVGPFDNRDRKGFALAYPPEAGFDFAASYAGKEGAVKWHEFATTDPYGQVDLNRAVGKHLGAVAYAAAEFESERDRDVELRLGTENACKLWLNGKLLVTSEVYHSFTSMDQFVGRGTLRAGRNLILVKLCQNEQSEDWAQVWQFQIRACDPTGTAILSRDRAAAIEERGRK